MLFQLLATETELESYDFLVEKKAKGKAFASEVMLYTF